MQNDFQTNTSSLRDYEREAVAANLQRIAAAVGDAPDVDAERIEATRDALSRGVYEVNPERIAEKLIRFDTALSNAHRKRR